MNRCVPRVAWVILVVACTTLALPAQIFNWQAPACGSSSGVGCNVQSLEVFGTPGPGGVIGMRLSRGDPDTPCLLIVTTAAQDLPTPFGALLVDLTALQFTLDGMLDASGELTVTGAFPAGLPEPTHHLQAVTIKNGSLALSNRATITDLGVPAISIVTPSSGAVFNTPTPIVAVSLHGGSLLVHPSLTVLVDSQDVTANLSVTTTAVTGTLPALADGPHTMVASIDLVGGGSVSASRVFDISTGGGQTVVTGLVRDPDGNVPLSGVPVFFEEGGPVAVTDTQGLYTITGGPAGPGLHLAIDGVMATLPAGVNYTYPFYKRPMNVVAGAVNQAAVVNLPRIVPLVDFATLAAQGVFSCAQARFLQNYTLQNTQLGVSILIPAGTFVSFLGGADPCLQSLSIAPVDVNNPPSNLPEALRPDLLVTVQPTGMTFLDGPPGIGGPRPIAVTFPNVHGIENGKVVDLFSVDHQTGEFQVKGVLQAQGAQLVTIQGGLEGGSWHCWCPPAPTIPEIEIESDGADLDTRLGCSTNPNVQVDSGLLVQRHELPKRVLYDEPFGMDLVFSSARVVTHSIARIPMSFSANSPRPRQIGLQARANGVALGPEQWFVIPSATGPLGLNLPYLMDIEPVPSSVLDYEVRVTASYSLNPFFSPCFSTITSPPNALVSASRNVPTSALVDRRPDGPFGRGWSLSADDAILLQPGSGDLMVAEGTGRLLRYRNAAQSSQQGLRMSLYAESSDGAVTSFFSGRIPTPFLRSSSSVAAETVSSTIIPNVQFWNAPGPYLLHVGANGIQQTVQLPLAAGDDVVYQALSGQDTFGALLEGTLIVPGSGLATFTVFADDAFALEVDGQVVTSLTGVNPFGIQTGQINLAPGLVPFRIAYADHGGDSHLWVVASGAGLPGGVLPPASFLSASGPNIQNTWIGKPGDETRILLLNDSTYRREFSHGGRDTFDTEGRIVQRTDRRGRQTLFNRDAQGLITTIVDPVGGQTVFTYAGAHVTSMTDPAGRTTSFGYSGVDLTGITDPTAASWTYAYSPQGYLVARTNPDGHVNTHVYDPQGRFLSTTYPDGSTRAIVAANPQGHAGGGTYSYCVALSGISQSLSSLSLITARGIDELGRTTTINIDASAGTHEWIDPLGHSTTTTSDPVSGQIQFIDYPDGSRDTFEWDADRGLLLAFTRGGDPNTAADDRRTEYFWHPTRSWLVARKQAVGTPEERTETFERDGVGNLRFAHDGLGNVTEFQYGSLGTDDLSAVIDPTGMTFTLQRDPVTGSTNAMTIAGRTTTISRGTDGYPIAVILPDGSSTQWTRDALGRVLQTMDAAGGVTTSARSPSGLLIALTDAKSPPGTTTLQYDARDRLVSWSDPLGHTESRSYFQDGALQSVTDRNGVTETRTYDLAGNLRERIFPSETITRTLDVMNRVASVNRSGITTTFSYSGFGSEVAAESTSVSGFGADSHVTHTYDHLGRPVSTDVALGSQLLKSIARTFDATGSQIALSETYSDPSLPIPSLSWTFAHDPVGRPLTIQRPQGITTSYAYDGAGRQVSVINTVGSNTLSQDGVSYDVVDNVVSVQQQRTSLAPNTATLQYDIVKRMESVTNSASALGSELFLPYDAVGNRRTATHVYDLADQLLSDGARFYSYDAKGRMVASRPSVNPLPRREFVFSQLDELVQVRNLDAGGAMTIVGSYVFDGLGRRVLRNGARFIHIGNEVAAVVDALGNRVLVARGPGVDQPLALVGAAGHVELLMDSASNVIQQVQNGVVIGESRYDAFGAPTESSGLLAYDGAVQFGFRGREWDAAVALYHNRGRTLLPELGRFLTRDPAFLELANGSPSAAHPYVYAFNNPLTFTDVDGETPWLVSSAIAFVSSLPTSVIVSVGGVIVYVVAYRVINGEFPSPQDTFNSFVEIVLGPLGWITQFFDPENGTNLIRGVSGVTNPRAGNGDEYLDPEAPSPPGNRTR